MINFRARLQISLTGAALSLWVVSGIAQTAGTPVTGKVLDEFKIPVKACVISFAGQNPSRDTTDAQGNFSLTRIASGLFRNFGKPISDSAFLSGRWNLYDFTGKRITTESVPSTQPTILQFQGDVGTDRLEVILGGPAGFAERAARIRIRNAERNLAKAGADANDTLVATCPDFVAKRIILPTVTTAMEVRVDRYWDIVVYGGTSGAVIAAVQAVKMGKQVVMVSPDTRLGGLSSGGLGETDIGNKAAIGGLSRDYYRRIAKKYLADTAWTREAKTSYPRYSTEEMWTFEPKVALEVFKDFIAENKVPTFYGERLDLAKGVFKNGKRIVSMTMESGKSFTGKMFIDATYEGDLMAKAGVSYAVGREANSVYGETFNGIQTAKAASHQLQPGISPYVKSGDATSGLLPGLSVGAGGADGSGDKRVQAYNYRMTLTTVPENRVAFTKPAGYDESLYELLFRHIEAGFAGLDFFNYGSMPNRKTDSNNSGGFSTDFIGMNYAYPDGDYVTRAAIIKAHENYQRGFLWTLANHPRIPQAVRDKYSQWGLAKDEFTDNGNWSPQLYIREARRMVGTMVMTQKEVTQTVKVTNSIGMAAYTMDSHNTQRYVAANGQVQNEGDVQERGFGPYPVAFGALVPKVADCTNLIVPFCLSASHIAFGSIRMEPVFMVMGQTSATMAAQAIDQDVDVQALDYAKLRARLLADKQILSLDVQVPGISVDDYEATLTGAWTAGSSAGLVGSGYQHDGNANKGSMTAEFTAGLAPGTYEVHFFYQSHANRATNVPVRVVHSGGETLVQVNEQLQEEDVTLGTFDFGATGTVNVTNAGTNGYVVIDGVTFIKK